MLSRRVVHWSIRLGQFGVSLLLVGLGLIGYAFIRPPLNGAASLIAETVDCTQQDNQNNQCSIEGKISAQNTVLEQGLVAYEQSEAVPDIRGDLVWSVAETKKPELLLETQAGPIRIKGEYILFSMKREITPGTKRYAGIGIGDPVVAIGSMAGLNQNQYLTANYLIAGMRAEHQAERVGWLNLGVGIMSALIGLIIMAVLLKKGYKPFGNWQTGK